VKLLTAAWLVLPQFEGASYLYERFVREHIRKYVTERDHLQYHPQQSKRSPNENKAKMKFVEFVTPKKVSYLIITSCSFRFITLNDWKFKELTRWVYVISKFIENCVVIRGIRRRIELAKGCCCWKLLRSVLSFSAQASLIGVWINFPLNLATCILSMF